jgi:hypothetical protein
VEVWESYHGDCHNGHQDEPFEAGDADPPNEGSPGHHRNACPGGFGHSESGRDLLEEDDDSDPDGALIDDRPGHVGTTRPIRAIPASRTSPPASRPMVATHPGPNFATNGRRTTAKAPVGPNAWRSEDAGDQTGHDRRHQADRRSQPAGDGEGQGQGDHADGDSGDDVAFP